MIRCYGIFSPLIINSCLTQRDLPRRLPPTLVTSETDYGRWIVACCRAHPIVCRCCTLCPRNTGPSERLARPRRLASHFPFAVSAVRLDNPLSRERSTL